MAEPGYLDIDDPDERGRAIALVAELEGRADTDRVCSDCGARVCGHEYVMNAAMGFKDAPRCLACLAEALGQPTSEFFARVTTYVDDRPCFRAAWEWSDEDEGSVGQRIPPCVAGFEAPGSSERISAASGTSSAEEADAAAVVPTASWDAGDMSCGDLVLALRLRLMRLEPGQVLALKATDPAAPEDLPAWCNLTRHTLIASDHPNYHIRRRNG